MISNADLLQYRLDPASLRQRFDMDPNLLGVPEKRLVERWKSRAQAGRDWNLTHYKTYLAIDRAWDSDFYQSTQTIIGMLKDLVETKSMDTAISVVTQWSMTHLLAPDIDAKTGQPTGKKTLNLPALYSVILSLPRAYTLMRVARIVNERMASPFMKFEPAFSSDLNRLYGDVLTQRVDVMNRDFGFTATFAQAVQGSAKYGQQIQFLQEEWYSKADYANGPKVGKEGLRYTLPHPTRTYYDLNHPLWTLNTGTGCRYAGYWRITSFDELRLSGQYWNTERVKRSYRMLDGQWQIFFQTTGQCAISHYPMSPAGGMFSQLDRESTAEQPYYTKSMGDQPVWLTEHFECFNPRIDLDDPNMPNTDLWLRVVLASDDTPLYVACLPDRPATAWLYEPDDTRAIQEGLVLQVLPFSDHGSNLISQAIVTAKQNLANVTLWDSSVLAKDDMAKIENAGDAFYRRTNFIEFDSRKLVKQSVNANDLFHTFHFGKGDIGAHLQVLGQLLALLERVVGMSAQEVGSYASHEQTAEEQRQIHQATSQRYEYVASWMDRAFEAWKSQVYSYLMAYGVADSYASVSAELLPMAQQAGFLVGEQDSRGNVLVQAPLNKLRVEGFTSQRDGPNRVSWQQIGVQMLQTLPAILQIPALANDGGQQVKMVNYMLEAMGFPRAFRITPPPQATPDVQAYIQEQLRAFADQAKGYVDQKIAEASAPPPAAPAEAPLPPELLELAMAAAGGSPGMP